LKLFQGKEEGAQKLRRSNTSRQIDRKRRSGPSEVNIQEELRRRLQKEETDSRRISLKNPVSH
jgi:hypothetical protein